MSDKKSKPEILKVIEYLDKMFDLRYNKVKGYPEYSIKDKADYKHADEMFINSQVIDLKLAGIQANYIGVSQILNSTALDEYDPFVEYFDSLTEWDESKPSELERLIATVKTDDQEYFALCLKRWMIALVASATNASIVNQQMIVLSGVQGLGKSTWISNLAPNQLKKYQFSGSVNPNNKDTYIHLAESLIINLDELSNMNKRESSKFKEIITQGTINIRRPFGRSSQILTRRASFIGSINDSEFLYDLTGSRRFLCFIVNHIDYKNDINIDLVYSEIKYLLGKKEKFYFDKEDIKQIEEKNNRFRVKTPTELRLLDKYSPIDLGVKCRVEKMYVPDIKILRATDIYCDLFKTLPSGGQASFLGKLLNKHKFEFTFIKGNKHYKLFGKPREEV